MDRSRPMRLLSAIPMSFGTSERPRFNLPAADHVDAVDVHPRAYSPRAKIRFIERESHFPASESQFFIMRSDRVELYELWIKEFDMWVDTIMILLISIFTALMGEGNKSYCIHKFGGRNAKWYLCCKCLGLTWCMVYRTEKYQKLKAEVEKQSKKCEFAIKHSCRTAQKTCIDVSSIFQWKRGKKHMAIL